MIWAQSIAIRDLRIALKRLAQPEPNQPGLVHRSLQLALYPCVYAQQHEFACQGRSHMIHESHVKVSFALLQRSTLQQPTWTH